MDTVQYFYIFKNNEAATNPTIRTNQEHTEVEMPRQHFLYFVYRPVLSTVWIVLSEFLIFCRLTSREFWRVN